MCYSNSGFLYSTGCNYTATLPDVFWRTSVQRKDPNSTKIGSRRDLKLQIFGAEDAENLKRKFLRKFDTL